MFNTIAAVEISSMCKNKYVNEFAEDIKTKLNNL